MSNILQCKGQSHIEIMPLLGHNGDVPSNLTCSRICNNRFFIYLIDTDSDIKAKPKRLQGKD